MPRDAFVLKIQRELCHPKYARKVSGLSRNGPQDSMWKPFHSSSRHMQSLTVFFVLSTLGVNPPEEEADITEQGE